MNDSLIGQLLIASTALIAIFGTFLIFFIIHLRTVQNNFYKEKQQFLLDTGMIEESDRLQNEIAKEIHDNFVQIACLIKMNLHAMEDRTRDEKQLEMLSYMSKITDEMINDANKILIYLNNDYIKSNPLGTILQHTMQQIFINENITFKIELKGKEKVLRPSMKTIVYRIATVAVVNIVKHASATQVYVLLHFRENGLLMQIVDNGFGFSREKLHSRQTTGLPYMYQRAKLLNGELNIDSRAGEGCKVTLNCPY